MESDGPATQLRGHIMSSVARSLLFVSVLFNLALSGCAPVGKAVVWKDPEVSLSDFQTFLIRPVVDASGQNIDPNTLSRLTALLKQEFRKRGLQPTESPPSPKGVLAVQTDLMALVTSDSVFGNYLFGPHSGGEYRCTVRSELVERVNSRTVASIVGTKEFAVFYYFADNQEKLLTITAEMVAEQVAKLMEAAGGKQ